MQESELERIQSASRDLRIAFLRDLFEKSAKISPKERAVVIPVSSFSLVALIRLLKDLNVPSHVFGTNRISVA